MHTEPGFSYMKLSGLSNVYVTDYSKRRVKDVPSDDWVERQSPAKKMKISILEVTFPLSFYHLVCGKDSYPH